MLGGCDGVRETGSWFWRTWLEREEVIGGQIGKFTLSLPFSLEMVLGSGEGFIFFFFDAIRAWSM